MRELCFIDHQTVDGTHKKTKPAVLGIQTFYSGNKAKLRNGDVVVVQKAEGVHNGLHYQYLAIPVA